MGLKRIVSGRIPVQVLLAFGFGLLFLLVTLVIGLTTKNPTGFLQWIVRVVLSLAAAGATSIIPGLFGAKWSSVKGTSVRVTGALAVFLVVYLVNPPALVGPKPEILRWEVFPEGLVTQGQTVTVRWAVDNADDVVVEPFGSQDLSGSFHDEPDTSRTYRLRASKGSRETVSAPKKVTVATPVPGAPVITRFEIIPETLGAGQSEARQLTLRWETRDPNDRVDISPGVRGLKDLPASGVEFIDAPSATTSYTLTARNEFTASVAYARVVVVPARSPAYLCNAAEQLEEQGLEPVWIESFSDDISFQESWEQNQGRPLVQIVDQVAPPCGGALRISGGYRVSRPLPSGSRPVYIAYSTRVKSGLGSSGSFEIQADDCEGRRGSLFVSESTDGTFRIITFGAGSGLSAYSQPIEPDRWHLVEIRINWDEKVLDVYLDGTKVNSEPILFATTAPAPAGCISLYNNENLVSFWDEIVVAGSPDKPPLAPTATPVPRTFLWSLPYVETLEPRTEYYPSQSGAYCLPNDYEPAIGSNPSHTLKVNVARYAEPEVVEISSGDTTCFRIQVDMTPVRTGIGPFGHPQIIPAIFQGEFTLIGRRR